MTAKEVFFASDEQYQRWFADEMGEEYVPTGFIIAFATEDERTAYLADGVEPEFAACTREEAIAYAGFDEVERWDEYCLGFGRHEYVPYEWRL